MIRSALTSDASKILALWNALIRDTDVTFTTELKLLAEIEALIDDKNRSVLIAMHEGAFAGFALLGQFRGGPGYAYTAEHTVYLVSDARGHGLGRMVMDRLVLEATDRGHHVLVAAISGSNQTAVKFHEKLGFEQVGYMPQVGHKNGVWHDLILMQKILETCADTAVDKG